MTLLSRVVLVVLVALLPALAAEIYNQRTLRDAQQAELRDDALREARAVAAELGRVLDGTRNALVAVAAVPAIAQEDRAACGPLLHSVGRRFAFLSGLSLVGADDRLVCSSTPGADLPEPPADWAQIRAVRSQGHFAVSGYVAAARGGAAQIGTGLPVRDSAGGAGPILVGNIGLDRIAHPIRLMAERDGADITLLDRNDTVLLCVPSDVPAGTRLPPPIWAAISRIGRFGVLDRSREEGRPTLLAVAALPDLIVTVRPDSLRAARTQMRAAQRSYATFAVGLLAAIVCAVLLARRAIALPVARILRTIALWRLGADQPRVTVTETRSELGRIGRAVNDLLMAFERTEAELRASKAELERRVETRTQQLQAEVREREATQALLQQSQKMEVIGQLTGGVAHDFNNLLTAILGNLELATMRSADRPEVVRLLANAARAADRGAALTQRMLAFGRRQFLRVQAVDLAALLAGMEDLLARTIGPTVLIAVHAEAGLWPARADPNQLELVVLNLAINARDAMPQGGRLAISLANETVTAAGTHPARLRPGQYVRLSLRDDGIGMDAATLGRVLEPFFTTKPAGKGSGLGLSMAHGVAAQLGGELAIQSAPGEGTQVDVWLPRDAGAPRGGRDSLGTAVPSAVSGQPAFGAEVLLVDDDPEVAGVTQQCLEDEGYRVRTATNGAEALALAESGAAVDLLIADLAMPEMNGAQLAARMRERLPKLPVLLATGYTDARGMGQEASGYPVLTKPFHAAQLLAAVAALIGPRAPSR